MKNAHVQLFHLFKVVKIKPTCSFGVKHSSKTDKNEKKLFQNQLVESEENPTGRQNSVF